MTVNWRVFGVVFLATMVLSAAPVSAIDISYRDSFEDEPADSGFADAWDEYPQYNQGTGAVIFGNEAQEGSQAFALCLNGSNCNVAAAALAFDRRTKGRVTVYMNMTDGQNSSGIQLVTDTDDLDTFSGRSVSNRVEMDGGDLVLDTGGADTLIATDPDRRDFVNVTITNIDAENDEFDVYWSVPGLGGSSGVSTDLPAGVDIPARGFDMMELQATHEAYFDNITVAQSAGVVRLHPLGDTDSLITKQSTTTFDGQDDSVLQVTDSDGVVELDPLAANVSYQAEIEVSGYYNRTLVIDDRANSYDTYLLNKSNTTNTIEFTLTDNTGDFPPDDTQVIVQRRITSGGTITYQTVASGYLGAANVYRVQLEQGERYKIRVKSGDDERSLGGYTVVGDERVNLQIGNVVLNPTGVDGPTVEASRINETGQQPQVTFQFNDSTGTTNRLWLEIYEYQNQSNVLLTNTSFNGPFGTFATSATITDPADYNNAWTVKYVLVRESGNVRGNIIVGPQRPVMPELPTWLVTMIFVGTIFMVAGLFSELNASLGAVVVAAVGALFFYVDLVPPQLGAGVMLLSLMAGAMIWINEHRGGNL